jgi:DNA-binding transcriptional ArsR family regulator
VTATSQTSGPAAIHAFADPSRRAILDRLVQGERAVGELVAALGLSQPAVSQHLRVLLDAGLVAVRQDGRRRIYRADPEGFEELRREVDRYWRAAVAKMKDDLEQREAPAPRGRARRTPR